MRITAYEYGNLLNYCVYVKKKNSVLIHIDFNLFLSIFAISICGLFKQSKHIKKASRFYACGSLSIGHLCFEKIDIQ